MRDKVFTTAAVIVMKAVAIIIKSLFMIFLMSRLTLAEIGAYNYSLVLSNFLVILGGLDIYAYAHHKLLTKKNHTSNVVNFHKQTQIISSTLLLLFLFLFRSDLHVDWKILSILVVSEYLLQEQYRYLVVYEDNARSNIQLFLRQVAWPMLAFFMLERNAQHPMPLLNIIFESWVFVNCAIYMIFASRYSVVYQFRQGSNLKRYIISLRRALIFSLPLLFGSLSYKIVEYSDRYLLEKFCDINELGVYSYLVNFSNTMQSFIFVGVVSLRYQDFVKESFEGKGFCFKNKFAYEIITWCLVISLLAFLSFPILNQLTGKQIMNEFKLEFCLLLVSSTILMLAQVPHYYLFAIKKMKAIFVAAAAAALITPICAVILISQFGIIGAALSSIIGSTLLLVFKTVGARNGSQ